MYHKLAISGSRNRSLFWRPEAWHKSDHGAPLPPETPVSILPGTSSIRNSASASTWPYLALSCAKMLWLPENPQCPAIADALRALMPCHPWLLTSSLLQIMYHFQQLWGLDTQRGHYPVPMTCNLHRTGLPALAVESMEQESNIGWLWVISVQVYGAGGWRWCLPLVWCWRWLLVHPALSAQGALLRRMSTQATWAKLWQTLQPPLYSVSSSRSTPAIFTSLSPYLNSATGRLVKRYISTLLIKNEANDFFFPDRN